MVLQSNSNSNSFFSFFPSFFFFKFLSLYSFFLLLLLSFFLFLFLLLSLSFNFSSFLGSGPFYGMRSSEAQLYMKMQEQVNKSDWHGSDILFKRKICIHLARGPSLANVTKKKITANFYFFYFWSLIEDWSKFNICIGNKNEKTKNIVLFSNHLQRELCFSNISVFDLPVFIWIA